MKQHWAGLGGGGLTVSFELLRELDDRGYIRVGDGGSSGSSKPPIGLESEDETEDFGPYMFKPNGNIEAVYYGADSDDQILTSMKEISETDYNKLIQPYESYMQILTGRGAGTGGVPERINQITDDYPEIEDWFSRVTSDMSGVFTPFFSLDGGSGFGFFETHMSMMDQGKIDNPSTVMPVAISPLRTEANRRVSWASKDIERRTSDNVIRASEKIESLLNGRGSLVDQVLLVDNDFAAFNQMCNEKEEYDYDYVFEKTSPIIQDRDFSEFNSAAKKNLNHRKANKAITRNLIPIFASLLRAPKNVKFGKTTQSGFDHNDLKNILSGFVVPSNVSLSNRSAIDSILGDYDVTGYDQKLAYMTFYTLHASCAPFTGDDIADLTVYIWDETRGETIGGEVKEGIVNLFSGVGLSGDQITVHPVKGITDRHSSIKIWTLTSVETMTDTLKKKFR